MRGRVVVARSGGLTALMPTVAWGLLLHSTGSGGQVHAQQQKQPDIDAFAQ